MKSTLVSDNQSPIIIEPGKAPLNAPPLTVACRRKARRLTAFSSAFVFARRNTSFNSAFRQLAPESSTVKTFVGDQFDHSGSGSSTLLFPDGDRCQCSACQRYFVRLRALAKQTNGKSIAVSHQHHFAAFAIFGASDSIAPFWTARMNRPEKPPPIRFSRRGRAMRATLSKSNPKLRLVTTHRIGASRLSANRLRLAGQPTRHRFLEHIKCRSSICGYRCAVVRALFSAMAKAVPALAIARRSNRVGS